MRLWSRSTSTWGAWHPTRGRKTRKKVFWKFNGKLASLFYFSRISFTHVSQHGWFSPHFSRADGLSGRGSCWLIPFWSLVGIWTHRWDWTVHILSTWFWKATCDHNSPILSPVLESHISSNRQSLEANLSLKKEYPIIRVCFPVFVINTHFGGFLTSQMGSSAMHLGKLYSFISQAPSAARHRFVIFWVSGSMLVGWILFFPEGKSFWAAEFCNPSNHSSFVCQNQVESPFVPAVTSPISPEDEAGIFIQKKSSAVYYSKEDFNIFQLRNFQFRALTPVMKSCKQRSKRSLRSSLDRANLWHRKNLRRKMTSFQNTLNLCENKAPKQRLNLWIRLGLCGWSCDNRCHVIEKAGPSASLQLVQ